MAVTAVTDIPTTMQAAQLVGEREYRMVEVPTPRPERDQVLVRITRVGICGTDSSFWKLHHVLNQLHPLPTPPGSHGHEAAGVVVEAGPDVKGVNVNDQVVRINLAKDRDWDMRCFAQYAVADTPVVVNAGDPRAVCFADPLAVAMVHTQTLFYPNMISLPHPVDAESLQRIAVGPHAEGQPVNVAIRGMGFIGVLVAQLLKRAGVRPIGLEVVDKKIEAARGMGIECWDAKDPDAAKKVVAEHGLLWGAVECCGSSDLDSLIAMLGDQAVCVLMGTSRAEVKMTYRPLRERGITLVCPSNAAMQTRLGLNYWEPAARLLENGTICPQSMIDAEYPLERLQEALEEIERRPEWHRVLINVG